MRDRAPYISSPVATSDSSCGSRRSIVRSVGSASARYLSRRSIAVLRRSVVAARFSSKSGNCAAKRADAGGIRRAPVATACAASTAACAASTAACAADLISLGLGPFGFGAFGDMSTTMPHPAPHCHAFQALAQRGPKPRHRAAARSNDLRVGADGDGGRRCLDRRIEEFDIAWEGDILSRLAYRRARRLRVCSQASRVTCHGQDRRAGVACGRGTN